MLGLLCETVEEEEEELDCYDLSALFNVTLKEKLTLGYTFGRPGSVFTNAFSDSD